MTKNQAIWKIASPGLTFLEFRRKQQEGKDGNDIRVQSWITGPLSVCDNIYIYIVLEYVGLKLR